MWRHVTAGMLALALGPSWALAQPPTRTVRTPDASGENRMPPIPADRRTEAQQRAVDEFAAVRGAGLSGPFHPLLRSPELMMRTRAMGDYLRFKSALPPRLREFVILLTAREWTQQYEWNAHYPIALKAGLDPEVARAVAEGRRPDAMAEDEAILYDFCLELQRARAIGDQTYARAVSRLGEQGVIDTMGLVGYYSMLAMVLNGTNAPLPPGVAPPLGPPGAISAGPESPGDEAQIRARRESSNAAIARHDPDGIGAILAPNFVVVTSNSVHRATREANVKSFDEQFRARPDVTYRRTPLEVRVFAPWLMASEDGTWTGSWTDPDGTIRLSGRYFAKWRKIDGAWFVESETYVPETCTGGAYCTRVP